MKVVRLYPTFFNEEDNRHIESPISMDDVKAMIAWFKKSKIKGLNGWIV